MATTLAKCLRSDKVSSLPLREVCRVSPGDSVEQVVRTMVGCRSGFALVMRDRDPGNNGSAAGARMVGIFTERDFVNRVVAAGLDVATPVERVMTPDPKHIPRGASVQAAIELMASGTFRHLVVVGERAEPLGVLSIRSVVHYLVEYFPAKVYNLPPTPDPAQPAREGA